MFNNPQIYYFQIFQTFKRTPPLIFIHEKHSKTHPKILKNIEQGMQLNWVIFWLKEILAKI